MTEEASAPSDSQFLRLARLPSGRHGLPQDFVAANHRDRLIAACAQEVPKRGYAETTVAHIIKTAAVSRRTFYEYFDSKQACFLATYDLVVAHLRGRVAAAFEAEPDWPNAVRAGTAALLGFLAEDPRLAQLCMVEPLAAGPPLSEHHREAVASFTPFLQAGRDPQRPGDPPEETEDAVVAGAALLITRRIALGQADQLEELLPGMVETFLSPFLGAAEAERVSRQAS